MSDHLLHLLLSILPFAALQGCAPTATPPDRTPLTNLAPLHVKNGLSSLGINCSAGSNFFPLDHRPIQIGEQKFEFGLSMKPDNEIVYRLDGRFQGFSAQVGADAETRDTPESQVRLLAIGDGQTLFDSGPIGPNDAPKPVDISIAGVKELRLRVESVGSPGANGDWAEAMLIGYVPARFHTLKREHRVSAGKLTAHVDADGKLARLETADGWKRDLAGAWRLLDVAEIAPPRVSTADGEIRIERTYDRGVTAIERFSPRGEGIRWQIELRTAGPAWNTPVETLIHWDTRNKDQIWAPWGHGLEWKNPLVPVELTTTWYEHGGFFNRFNGLPIPMLTLMDRSKDRAITILHDPEDRLFDMYTSTSSDGQIVFSRRNLRLGEGRVWRFNFDIVAHAADPRAALAAVVERYPHLFDPPRPEVHEICAGGGYSATEDALDAEKLRQMSFTYNWKASFDFPYMGLFLPPVSSPDEPWDRFGGDSGGRFTPGQENLRGKTTIRRMNDYSAQMRKQGFYVLNYFNVTEFGSRIEWPAPPRKAKDDKDLWRDANDFIHYAIPNAILRTPDDPIYTWSRALIVDCGDPAYKAFLLDQARRHIKELPDSSGIAIDRMDWLNRYNPHADDGYAWWNGGPCRSLFTSWLGLIDEMGPIFHNAGKIIVGNTMIRRLDLSKQLDAVYDEHGDFGFSLNLSSYLCLRKPLTCWTRSGDALKPDPDGYMQRHLYMGAFLTVPISGNDHTILPEPWVERLYLDYGPMFNALKGRRWVLRPHVIEVQGDALANVFEVPSGFTVPVTFAKESVSIRLRGLELDGFAAEVLLPGETTWQPLVLAAHSDGVAFSPPIRRGAAIVRFTRNGE